jgi:hypothetical protein
MSLVAANTGHSSRGSLSLARGGNGDRRWRWRTNCVTWRCETAARRSTRGSTHATSAEAAARLCRTRAAARRRVGGWPPAWHAPGWAWCARPARASYPNPTGESSREHCLKSQTWATPFNAHSAAERLTRMCVFVDSSGRTVKCSHWTGLPTTPSSERRWRPWPRPTAPSSTARVKPRERWRRFGGQCSRAPRFEMGVFFPKSEGAGRIWMARRLRPRGAAVWEGLDQAVIG